MLTALGGSDGAADFVGVVALDGDCTLGGFVHSVGAVASDTPLSMGISWVGRGLAAVAPQPPIPAAVAASTTAAHAQCVRLMHRKRLRRDHKLIPAGLNFRVGECVECGCPPEVEPTGENVIYPGRDAVWRRGRWP